jgi:hypothetical protein
MPGNSDFTGQNLPVFLTMLKQTANDGLNIYEKHIYKFLKICAIGNKEHLLKQILI